MAWYEAGGLLVGTILVLMAIRMPVAMAFLAANLVAALIFIGGEVAIMQLVANATTSVTTFTLVPVPLFLLMGELFFHTGVALRVFDAIDRLLGRIPGRLSYLTVGGGTLFAALSGSSIANIAMLGSTLLPQMQARRYKPVLSMGPIIATGGLAIMIPPSALGVLLGSIAQIDIGKLLIAGIVPGLLLASAYVAIIAYSTWRDPEAAPRYAVEPLSLGAKLRLAATNVLPMAGVIFMVVGLIILGIATPSEAAAFGVLGVLVLAIIFRSLTWESVRKSVLGTVRVTGMVFLIIVGASTFSQMLALSGASSGLIGWVTTLSFHPLWVLAGMLMIVLLLGMLMESVSIIMLVAPIFFPLAAGLGYDSVWLAILILLMLEISLATPPFGIGLFVLAGVAPRDVTLSIIVRASLPYIAAAVLIACLLVAVPELVTFLPGLMG
ncbi:TRAP transporter large permease [Brucella anthropi]|uniref:TRAP transporter large permease n=1 Tax=Brucella anthropi TaxID=529 RepID=UPI00124F595C|nr:TRAP transporter large permease [Brucella anthropi]KAB2726485.1 TRAP transporter large permease [Brucella anthropi]KAB2743647.1 TRAP transporter large permease [Brucella anthropi]KAB2804394.1 TRAP transporter large permease [Brucella anthropi]